MINARKPNLVVADFHLGDCVGRGTDAHLTTIS